MDPAQRRKASNEAMFRQVNEQIERLQHAFALTEDEPLSIVCECDRLDCAEMVRVPVDAYERTRADPARFLVVPGHEDESIESVVDSHGHYLIVRKRPGEPQRVAEATDPRS